MDQNFINTNNQNTIIHEPNPSQTVRYLSNSDYLKERLCCPRIWTGILFVLQVISLIVNIFTKERTFRTITTNIGITLIFFVVAFLVTKSAMTCDVEQYKNAIYAFIIYFVYIIISSLVDVGLVAKAEKINDEDLKKAIINLITNLIGDSITLCILCCYKKEFEKITPNQINI